MSIRTLPALCAGAMMLAACAPNALEQTGAISTGAINPGIVEDHPCGYVIGDTVYFETDSALLTTEAQQVAQRQACWIALFPHFHLTIEGHADERATREYNLALGIDPERPKTISYGKERPVCTEANEACWSQNRRGVSTLDQ